jgi:hypothetical protein
LPGATTAEPRKLARTADMTTRAVERASMPRSRPDSGDIVLTAGRLAIGRSRDRDRRAATGDRVKPSEGDVDVHR